ncbi:tRNA lysidine(34) synthetase TilS [Microbacterium halotolerans]|uniref:tRNA lysidine(34) synthetase TilS n=1 Tax=Microbacterium halotolerans TaxID=246613 RepID=UPI000E6A9C46|nr:tRNA lysidine(34) synthetase TilS [Microbacterium halotolerans]
MLDPAIAACRLAVRGSLRPFSGSGATVLVALSGGADSLALAAAAAHEAPKLGLQVSTVTVDHGLQADSDQVAERAAEQARALKIPDARIARVEVGSDGGPEAAARDARYGAIARVASEMGAVAVLLGHTLDDQAETVLLALARGAGAGSLQGMAPRRVDERGLAWVRPFLALRRDDTRAFCAASGIEPWQDPHNSDDRFSRVRVRERVLPVLETELGPGIAEALARTAEQLREDNEAFADMIEETIEDIVEHAEAGIAVSAAALEANPSAIRNRIIRLVAQSEFGVSLTRRQTLEIARLVTDWHGQGPIDLPGFTAERRSGRIVLAAR